MRNSVIFSSSHGMEPVNGSKFVCVPSFTLEPSIYTKFNFDDEIANGLEFINYMWIQADALSAVRVHIHATGQRFVCQSGQSVLMPVFMCHGDTNFSLSAVTARCFPTIIATNFALPFMGINMGLTFSGVV